MALNHSPRIVTDGLVLCLDAANRKSYPGSGTIWSDLSGNGNSGTLVNGVGYSSDGLGSLTFDGGNAYVSLPDNITDLSGDWAISVWVYPINDDNPRIMTLITSVDNLEVGYMNNTLVPYLRIDSSTVSSTTSIPTGSWSNIVYQVSNGTRQIYINSLLTNTVSGGINGDGMYSAIGGGYDDYQFNGNLSIGAVYNRALSESEIQQNFQALRGRYSIPYNDTPGIVPDGLVLNLDAGVRSSYPGSGTTWNNLSRNGYNAFTVNDPVFSSDGYFTFDGANDYAYLTGLTYGGGNTISEMSVFGWIRTSFNSVAYNDNWAFLDFDRSEAFNFYVGGTSGTLYMSGRSSNTGGFTTYYDLPGNNTYDDGNWHYIGWTFSVANQEIVLYGDGEIDRVYTANGSMTALGSGATRYGIIGDGSEATAENGARNNIHYQGDIGTIHLWDTVALTPSQVQQNFQALRGRYGI